MRHKLRLFNLILIVVFIFSFTACTFPKTAETTIGEKYSVGDTGPAGGLIFYVNPNYKTDGWRYLEAAPSDQSAGLLSTTWDDGREVATGASGTVIGTGKANTQTIVKALKGLDVVGIGSYAAQLCNDLTIGGYSDWFLPSKDELNEMYENLYLKGVGGFTGVTYWSSSEYSALMAWAQYFPNGNQVTSYKFALGVRAARAF